MKLKDALLSIAIGHYIATSPIWEVRDNLWLINLMAILCCWDLIIWIEQLASKVKKYLQKRKRAREAATSSRAQRKLNLYQL